MLSVSGTSTVGRCASFDTQHSARSAHELSLKRLARYTMAFISGLNPSNSYSLVFKTNEKSHVGSSPLETSFLQQRNGAHDGRRLVGP